MDILQKRYQIGYQWLGRVWWSNVTPEQFLSKLQRIEAFAQRSHDEDVLLVFAVGYEKSFGRWHFRCRKF